MSTRDRASARQVCRHWRSAIDDLTVRCLALRTLGPGNWGLSLLRRFPLLTHLTLGTAITSNRTVFSVALSTLPSLAHLASLSLEFATPASVHLPSALHVLRHLKALSVSTGCAGVHLWGSGVAASASGGAIHRGASGATALGSGSRGRAVSAPRQGQPEADWGEQGLHPADSSGAGSDGDDLDWGYGSGTHYAPGSDSGSGTGRSVFGGPTSGTGSGFGAGAGARGGARMPPAADGAEAAAQLRRPPPGLLPLLSALPELTSLELVHLGISVPDVLRAVRLAAATAAAVTGSSPASGLPGARGGLAGAPGVSADTVCGHRGGGGGSSGSGVESSAASSGGLGGLQRLVLVGSGVNLTGVGEPAAAAQLAALQVLYLDSCTGADALMPLLPHLSRLRRLDLAGMDYAWAAAAGYHRRAGFDSTNNLQQHLDDDPQNNNNGPNGPNGPAELGNHHHHRHHHHPAHPNGSGGLLWGHIGAAAEAPGGPVAAALAAAASGRPLAFLSCLPALRSLNLAGSFLRTVPNRDIAGLTAVTALDLSGNGLDDLPYGLTSLPLLRVLDVSNNELVALPAWLSQMQSLRALSCHHNGLERFPTGLYDLPRLSYLAMGHNRISWWPVECLHPRHRRPNPAAAAAAAAAAAEAASVEATAAAAAASSPAAAAGSSGADAGPSTSPAQPQHRDRPAAFTSLPLPEPPEPQLALSSLDLSHNRLFGLPGGLPALTSLRCLRLRDCLSGLDGGGTARAIALIAGLTGLRELDLSSNHLDQHCIVPLSELRSLRQLWLADNGLEELPLGLARLNHLTLLSLRANRFGEVPVCLRWLTSLEFLDMSCNRLQELPPWVGGTAPDATAAAATAAATAAGRPGASFSNGHSTGHSNSRGGSDSGGSELCEHQRLHQQQQQQRKHLAAAEQTGCGGAEGGTGSDPLPGSSQQHPQHPPQQHPHQHRGSERRISPAHPQPPASSHGDRQGAPRPRRPPGSSSDAQPRTHHHQDHHQHHRHHSPHPEGLLGLRHLDVSQQYSVEVRESSLPHVPPRLEVQPPHCLYGPLQGDLPEELLRLPYLRTLVLQRHLLPLGSRVLRRLRARGVDVVHPRPLRVESLPGAAAAALTTAAAAGGLLFPGTHPELRAAAALAAGAGGGGAAGANPAAAAAALAAVMRRAAAERGGGGSLGRSRSTFLGPGETALMLALVVVTPVGTAMLFSALGLPGPPHVVLLVVVAATLRLALYGVCLLREADRRRERQRDAAALALAAAAALGGGAPAAL